MSEREIRERDILVAPNEYAYVQDLTKGDIVLYVGPTKISLSNTERVVELRSGRFVPVRSDEGLGVSAFVNATEAQYVVIENPPKDPTVKPMRGPNASIELLVGRKIVVPGPATFPLWPGQRATVVEAQLRKGYGLHVRMRDGQELFFTDREGYFIPTEELEVVGEVAPIPIDDRQGLYVRDIATGRVDVIEGPASYLPDPTKVQVIGPARTVTIPSGFAVLVTAQGKRQVVRGPTTRILAMGEELETLKLSTGKPKTAEKRIETRFLQISGNKVSDIIEVKTRDHNDLEVTLSYRVSFVNEDSRWFDVEDYVGLLCDHLGSLVRAAARRSTLEQMHSEGVEIVRSAVLGDRKENTPRPGRYFEENGMLAYDVEVLEIRILDQELEEILDRARHNAILADVSKREEALQRGVLASKLETFQEKVKLEEAQRGLQAAEILSRVTADREEKLGLAKNETDAHAMKHAMAEREAELAKRALEMRVAGFERQMAALHPELVATLKTLGNQQLATELSRNVSPLAILGGESVTDVVERLLGSLPMGNGHVRDVLPAKPAKR